MPEESTAQAGVCQTRHLQPPLARNGAELRPADSRERLFPHLVPAGFYVFAGPYSCSINGEKFLTLLYLEGLPSDVMLAQVISDTRRPCG
jgi:hypothetical protein